MGKAFSLLRDVGRCRWCCAKIAFFSAIRPAINKFTTVDKQRSDRDRKQRAQTDLDNAIVADGVAIFTLAGLG